MTREFDERNAEDQPARWFRTRDASRLDSRGCRRRDRPRPRQGGAGRAGGRRIARSHAALRRRCTAGAGHRRDEADALELVRHDYAHVLAEAVQSLFPGTQITFGPSTDDGFYYDFAPPADRGPFTEEDLPRSKRRCGASSPPTSRCTAKCGRREQLISRWRQQGETFKAEWANELPEGEELTVYWSGLPHHPRPGSTCAAARIWPRPASSIRRPSS